MEMCWSSSRSVLAHAYDLMVLLLRCSTDKVNYCKELIDFVCMDICMRRTRVNKFEVESHDRMFQSTEEADC